MAVEVNLESILDPLEDANFDSRLSTNKDYQTIVDALNSKAKINVNTINRLLVIIEKDIKKKDSRKVSALSALTAILEKIKKREWTPCPDLLPTAVAIINEIDVISAINDIELVKQLLFRTLYSYPDDVLIQAYISHHEAVEGIIVNYCFQRLIIQNREMPVKLFIKLLKILPPEERLKFIENHLDLWFVKAIPMTMEIAITGKPHLNLFVEAIEILTETLVQLNYDNDPAWLSLYNCIHTPNNYPAVLKKMIEISQEAWYKLWIVCIKLLKDDITKQKRPGGSPINALLPVVELAFKMLPEDRCRAFKCWNVLISIFSKEDNPNQVQKRVKLLVIPLKSNNAKTECTVLEKLNTWWHLLRSFENRLDNFIDLILIPFLHFCYGKDNTNKLYPLIRFPSVAVKKKCVEMFVEVAGHVNCEGCVVIPRLKNRVISLKLLIDHWNDWLYCLTTTIKIANEVNSDNMKQTVTCIWESFLLTISELPPNNVRKDLFNDLLKIVVQLPKEKPSNLRFADSTSALIKSLFEEENIKQLLRTKDTTGPLHTIFSVILDPCMNDYYKRKSFQEVVSLFKPITNFVVSEPQCSRPPSILEWNGKDMLPNDNTLMLWTALAESLCELESGSHKGFNLSNLLLWPMRNMTLFTNARAENAWYRWHTLYELKRIKVNGSDIDSELLDILSVHHETTENTVYFQLIAALDLLKQSLVNSNASGSEKPADMVIKIIGNENNLRHVEKMIPVIVDVLTLFISKVTETENVPFAKLGLLSVKAMLNSSMKLLKLYKDNGQYMTLFENLLKRIEAIFKINAYFPLKDIIIDQLLECPQKVPSVKDTVFTLLKLFLSKCKETDPVYEKIKAVVDPVRRISDNRIEIEKSYFPVPDSKPKKSKGPNIVNTVVENGEEYVVVKSNWKFNPKKLTENQKEKLVKKREDIPALYQDLSQSQDEFKISAWKTDSQDTSTTSSKSASKSGGEDVSTVLKNIPCSEVVPKIMENILSDKETAVDKEENFTISSPKQVSAVKEPRTPRLALKDRVFRNVRNLMEKSGSRNENEISVDLNKTVGDNNKTPNVKTSISASVVNSAPPKINSERPARVIKKPKKFDDVEVFALKKRRRLHSTQSEHTDSAETRTNITEHEQKTEDQTKTAETLAKSNNDLTVVMENAERTPEKKQESETIVHHKSSTVSTNAIEPTFGTTLENKEQVSVEISSLDKKDNQMEVDTNVPEVKAINSQENHQNNEDVVEAEKIQTDCTSSTPKLTIKEKEDRSSVKKKRSRIEKQLMIDMVEGHPLLQASKEERFTRKKISSPGKVIKRKSLAEKMNKVDPKNISKTEKKSKSKVSPSNDMETVAVVTVESSQERLSGCSDDMPNSEDIIESSQDSSITTISVKSTKTSAKKPIVKLCRSKEMNSLLKTSETQRLLLDSNNLVTCDHDTTPIQPDIINISPSPKKSLRPDRRKHTRSQINQKFLDNFNNEVISLDSSVSSQQQTTDDISLPKNKTMLDEKTDLESTENMDTQPFEEKEGYSDVVIINDYVSPVVIDNTEKSLQIGPETQEIADADTQPNYLTEKSLQVGPETQEIADADTQPNYLTEKSLQIGPETQEIAEADTQPNNLNNDIEKIDKEANNDDRVKEDANQKVALSPNTLGKTSQESNNACSPLKDGPERNKNFLNNTIEISPIKTLSPVRQEKSPSPETSSDFLVIKLSSPVQSNGEPFNEQCDSPEIFTEDKVSPEKRDQSPPRLDVPTTNTSPSSSLSLKKNRPQMRSSGRAAQMLGLCAPDKLKAIMNSDRSTENEETKKSSSPLSTPARRNLRILYNSVGDSENQTDTESVDTENGQEEIDNFLKFKRTLPSANSSPANPILKRKLADIADEATISPASKRKRVSFHDPPVSTMVSIQKYIEPMGLRSPQSSVSKRQEKQLRPHTNMKSPKRLDNVFKLDTILTKAVESFCDDITMVSDDTQTSSIEQTPAVEVVKTSDLNDTEPICPELLDCQDSINEIAGDLSSPAMKDLLIKELEGKVETIADLAKMTELEINRLCIKAPKVKVVKKVLANYVAKKDLENNTINSKEEIGETINDQEESANKVIDLAVDVQISPNHKGINIEIQTDGLDTKDMDMQTDVIPVPEVKLVHTQTDLKSVLETSAQTIESGFKSTKDLIASCLSERSDFVEELTKQLEEPSVRAIAEMLPTNTLMDILTKKIIKSDSTVLSFVRDHLCERFDVKDLILFCSQLLQKVHDKPA